MSSPGHHNDRLNIALQLRDGERDAKQVTPGVVKHRGVLAHSHPHIAGPRDRGQRVESVLDVEVADDAPAGDVDIVGDGAAERETKRAPQGGLATLVFA